MSNDSSFTPPPAVEQIQVARPKSSGINVPTFIISLVLVAAIAGGAGWFVGNSGGYASAQAEFRNNPQSFIQAAGGFGAGGFGAAGGNAGNAGNAGTDAQGHSTGTGGTAAGRGGFAGGFRGTTQGKVTAVNGNSLTVETADKTLTVNTSNTTRVAGVNTLTLGDLKAGDRVTVLGPTSGNTITATAIVSGSITGLFGDFGRPGGADGAAGSGTPVPNP